MHKVCKKVCTKCAYTDLMHTLIAFGAQFATNLLEERSGPILSVLIVCIKCAFVKSALSSLIVCIKCSFAYSQSALSMHVYTTGSSQSAHEVRQMRTLQTWCIPIMSLASWGGQWASTWPTSWCRTVCCQCLAASPRRIFPAERGPSCCLITE